MNLGASRSSSFSEIRTRSSLHGLYLCQHRFYDPANGRWLNRDPIGYGGGTNLYGYCGDGPVNAGDSSGLQSEIITGMWQSTVASQMGDAGDFGRLNGTILGTEALGVTAPFVFEGVPGAIGAGLLGGGGVAGVAQAAQLGEEYEDNGGTFLPTIGSSQPLQLQYGNWVHNTIQQGYLDLDEGWERNFSIPGYGRADLYNPLTNELIEIKPDNDLGITRGVDQLDRYLAGLQNMGAPTPDCYLLTYTK